MMLYDLIVYIYTYIHLVRYIDCEYVYIKWPLRLEERWSANRFHHWLQPAIIMNL